MSLFQRMKRLPDPKTLLLITAGIALATATLPVSASTPADPFQKLTQTDLDLGHHRTGNGLPAETYWQQQVDYSMAVQLDPRTHRLTANAEITYHNRSPDPLQYLYFALDHNALKPGSSAAFNLQATDGARDLARVQARQQVTGFDIESVTTTKGTPLTWRVLDTYLQVTLAEPIRPGNKQKLSMHWTLPLADKMATGARSGFELLEDGAPIYVIAQWFPRAAAYTDYAGWQLKPFLQQGEFSTEFGNYRVSIEVPANYVVAASGNLDNPQAVLSPGQLETWNTDALSPVQLVDGSQAERRRTTPTDQLQTWVFSGEQLRDFAFSASPAFLWQMKTDGQERKLQQFYPSEAAPLWEKFGLAAIEHTLMEFDSALMPLKRESISIVNASGFGMEYPGLATIATRPEREESTPLQPAWDALTKYDFIGTVIHEVGHNYLPMSINTDEREWAWLDEGLTSFVEYQAEHSWEANFDVIYGEPRSIADYLASEQSQPVISSADALHRKIDNAYNKTASMLNILRHLVLGADVFDPALANFARHWQGKRPMPGDFFRALETAAGTDLSWFWRSWFFENHYIDLALESISVDEQELIITPAESVEPPAIALTAGSLRTFVVDLSPDLADTYTATLLAGITHRQSPRPVDQPSRPEIVHEWHTLIIANKGQGVLPVPLKLQFEDGHEQAITIPATTWMRGRDNKLTLQLPLKGTLVSACIDPLWLTPDTDRNNNCVEVKAP